MRPGIGTREGEVVGIGDLAPRRLLRLEHPVRNRLPLAIGDRLLLGLEPQSDLLVHVRGRGPAHQRLDLTRLLRHVFEHPFLGLGGTRLHGGPRRLVDAREHGLVLTSPRDLGAFAPLVGAAGFEPATWSTQNSRATRLRYAPPGAAGGRSARLWI